MCVGHNGGTAAAAAAALLRVVSLHVVAGLLAGPMFNLGEILPPQGVWRTVSSISSCVRDIRGQQSLLVPDQAKLPVLLETAVQTHPCHYAAHHKELLASWNQVATDWTA